MLSDAAPVIAQTPGRLQYYRAENEPFLPDEVKWGLRMPNKFAIRDLPQTYEDEVQQQILKFLGQTLKHDYLNANKDINLDLVLSEASLLYNANDKIKEMAETGELQALHERCNELDTNVATQFAKVMDQLDRVLAQIEEQETEIYEELIENNDLTQLRSHSSNSMTEVLSGLAYSDVAVENYQLAQQEGAGADSHSEIYSSVQSLRQYIGVRAEIFKAKANVLEEVIAKINENEDSLKEDLRVFQEQAETYERAFNGDVSELSGDA